MDSDIVKAYLEKSGMELSQADALARVLDHFATRDELLAVEQRLRTDIAKVEARLTWRFIAVTTVLASVLTVLNLFVG